MTDREKVIRAVETCFDSWIDKHRYKGLDLHEVERMKHDALELLKEQEPVKPKVSEWLEDSDPGQEYGTTWACWKCTHSIHEAYIWNPYDSGYKYCPHCGAKMEVKLDD